ncbi:hypothetical protein BDW59DRAFT_62226 [Aspergillus cavernicola]|uniref:Emopamil-binding protein n=1 Tax=Aspergillus cavernicola TaxID=176166 RepID=A0ABR4IGM0_9EURO
MVSTRHHPRDFPPPSTARASTPSNSSESSSGSPKSWVHTPTTAVTLWLLVSCPLVLWDAGYVLLRPHSMPGGKWHSPIWSPYALYSKVDYVYGWPALNANDGFPATQSILNLVETAGYLYYLWVVYKYGTSATSAGRGQPKSQKGLSWILTGETVVAGRRGATAVLVAFSASVMTLSKTVLYWMQEALSGFVNIGHNDLRSLVILWIIPNGLWLIFPTYNIYVLGEEIISSLANAAPRQRGRPKLQ